jgi:TPR repeat protein
MTTDQLLAAGRYAEVSPGDDAHSRAAWAFARYHLVSGREAAQAAQLAHEQGEALGTFVLLLCQRSGAGVLHDEAVMDRLNYQLRTRLETIASPSPLELYVLSLCVAGNEAGLIESALDELPKLHQRAAQQRWQRLHQSAELDFAQACSDVAGTYQRQNDLAQAYQWFRRAGDLGLAEGKRGASFLMGHGAGVPRDPVAEVALAREAAEAGDAFAMINVASYHERGSGMSRDPETARSWIDRAAATGHWMGLQEKGLALLVGHYGYPIDEAQGKHLMEQAARTGFSDALLGQARFYAQGTGVKRDVRLSIRFAEGAFRQGNRLAARGLSEIYRTGAPGVPANEELARFWLIQTKADHAFAVGPTLDESPLLQRIAAIDPFSLVVE